MKLYEIDQAIRLVCPIEGLNSNGEIFFNVTATDQQKADAMAIMDAELPNLTEDL